jgi:hypothetical protein
MQKIWRLLLTATGCVVLTISYGQQVDSAAGKIVRFPSRLLSRLQAKTARLNGELTAQTTQYLQQQSRREEGLRQRLSTVDPAGARQLFGGNAQTYQALTQRIKTDTGRRGQSFGGSYPAYLDSVQGSVKFLQQNPQLLQSASPGQLARLQATGTQLQTLQAKMNDADAAKAFVQQRSRQIGQYLAQHGSVQGILGGSYAGINKATYYYGQQLRQYKEMWSNPDELEQRALALLNRLPAFQIFMKENSMLGGLFHLPGNYSSPQAISGLQTKTQVAELVHGQVSAAGAAGAAGGAGAAGAGEAALQGSLQSAESSLDTYKSKLSQLGSGNGDMDLPGFQPNAQKTKTLWKRLEYGADFQTTHTDYYFPMVTDLGLSLGYKLGHSNIVGVGASFKLGWGNGIQHIAFTGQGVGLRSFLQVHIKGSISATGGFEYNYTTPFTNYQQLRQIEYWTRSGLIGVTKTISLKSRVFKKTSVSLLWDFLSYQQIPQTQPFLFRLGYTF